MHNKTVVFDAQQEIADLKRRVQQLENEKIQYGQPLKVSDYPAQPPIFGPQPTRVYESPWSQDQGCPNSYHKTLIIRRIEENKLD